MTSIEVETPASSREILTLVEESGAREHYMHLTSTATKYTTGEGTKIEPSITATCSCGAVMTGLQDAAQVFAVLQEHCPPL